MRMWSRIARPTILRIAKVECRGQVQPAFTGRDVSDVGEPYLVRCICHEALRQQARRNRQVVAAFGRPRQEPTACQRANAVSAHQPLDAATAAHDVTGQVDACCSMKANFTAASP